MVVGWRTTATASQRYHGRCRIPVCRAPIHASTLGCPATRLGRIVAATAPSTTSIARAVLSGGPSPCGRPTRRGHDGFIGNRTTSHQWPIRAGTFTSQQISDAKENVCVDTDRAPGRTKLNTNQANPVPAGAPDRRFGGSQRPPGALHSGGELPAEASHRRASDSCRVARCPLAQRSTRACRTISLSPDSVVTPWPLVGHQSRGLAMRVTAILK